MSELMSSITGNWEAIIVIVLAAHTLLKAISRVTKTKKDDALADQLGAIIGYILGKDPEKKTEG